MLDRETDNAAIPVRHEYDQGSSAAGPEPAPIRALAGHENIRAGPPKPRLLDRVRDAIRARHYSRRTEKSYVAWIRRYIVFHGKRHPPRWARRRSGAS